MASPAGKPVGFIPTKEFCANVTFGGADGKTLYLTCNTKVYSLAMNVSGGEHAARAERKGKKKGLGGLLRRTLKPAGRILKGVGKAIDKIGDDDDD